MIIGNFDTLMVHMDKFYIPGSESNDLPNTTCPQRFSMGAFHFIIDGKFYPNYICNSSDELCYITDRLKENLIEGKKLLTSECNYTLEEYNNFVKESMNAAKHCEDYTAEEYSYFFTRHQYCLIDLSDGCGFEDAGFICKLGFQDDKDRLFYADSYSKNEIYKEAQFPRGTVEKLIFMLPDAKELELVLECENDDIYRTYARTVSKKTINVLDKKLEGFIGDRNLSFSWFEKERSDDNVHIYGYFQMCIKSKNTLQFPPKVVYIINYVIDVLCSSLKNISENQTDSNKSKEQLFADAVYSRAGEIYSDIELVEKLLQDKPDEVVIFQEFRKKRFESFDTPQGAEIKFYADIANQGLKMFLFRNKNKDRLIYSYNNGKDVFEARYPLGTVKNMLEELEETFNNQMKY